MAHVRKQIREAVASVLMDLNTTQNRVYVSRVYPLERSDLPGLVIMTGNDEVDLDLATSSAGGMKLWSHLQLIIKAYAKNTVQVDADLDQIELEVRTALAANRKLNGLAKDINWLRTDIQLEGLGEQPMGVAEMQFRVDYRVLDSTLEAALP